MLIFTEDMFKLLSCSEDGQACFWDIRNLTKAPVPSQVFVPGKIRDLQRPLLGNWLTVASTQKNDSDWVMLGGGPKLSLWNRKAGQHTTIFQPEGQLNSHHHQQFHFLPLDRPESWYPQTCLFAGHHTEPKIVAGGTSSSFLAWDHSGETLFETDLSENAVGRLSHILTMAEVANVCDELTGCLLVGGAGAAIHLISRLGYPLKQVGQVFYHYSLFWIK